MGRPAVNVLRHFDCDLSGWRPAPGALSRSVFADSRLGARQARSLSRCCWLMAGAARWVAGPWR